MITVKVGDEELYCPYAEWLVRKEWDTMQNNAVIDRIAKGKL
tara:strand:- start:19961 stop:20086 length:126 start_codon:yes stop_codon:yes gene_type:complete